MSRFLVGMTPRDHNFFSRNSTSHKNDYLTENVINEHSKKGMKE